MKFCETCFPNRCLLVTSNFSFSHSVFKRLVLETSKPGLVWEMVNGPVEGRFCKHYRKRISNSIALVIVHIKPKKQILPALNLPL